MNHFPRQITLSEDDRRLIGFWAADCAERVLPLFEAKAPTDTRPRDALNTTLIRPASCCSVANEFLNKTNKRLKTGAPVDIIMEGRRNQKHA